MSFNDFTKLALTSHDPPLLICHTKRPPKVRLFTLTFGGWYLRLVFLVFFYARTGFNALLQAAVVSSKA